MEYLRKQVLARGMVYKLPEQLARATKFPILLPKIGKKLSSCHNNDP